MMAPARVAASCSRWRAPVKKLMWRASAFSSEATWWITVSAAPATRPPSRATICPSVSGPGTNSLRRRLALLERLDHLVGDVDARACEDGVLEDDVVLLLLGDLADHPVRLLDDLRQLLVAPLRVAHRDAVLFQLVLHALELVGDARHLLVALLELGLDLLLRALRRNGVAQDALGVDEAELAGERRRGRLVLRQGEGRGQRAGGCQRGCQIRELEHCCGL